LRRYITADCAGCVLVRLAHLYEAPGGVGWDKDLSQEAKVDLKRLFPHRGIVSVREVLLSGVPPKGAARGAPRGGGGAGAVGTVLTLGPMEIRAVQVLLK
jgi:hypothetical protein